MKKLAWFLCLNCGRVREVDMTSLYDAIIDFKDQHEYFDADFLYKCRCDICNNEDMFDIDFRMIDPIMKLNRKGYTTQFCCEGHYKENSYFNGLKKTQAYILFADDRKIRRALERAYKKDRPAWEMSRYPGNSIKLEYTQEYDSTTIEPEFDKLRDIYMLDLKQWINSLPSI